MNKIYHISICIVVIIIIVISSTIIIIINVIVTISIVNIILINIIIIKLIIILLPLSLLKAVVINTIVYEKNIIEISTITFVFVTITNIFHAIIFCVSFYFMALVSASKLWIKLKWKSSWELSPLQKQVQYPYRSIIRTLTARNINIAANSIILFCFDFIILCLP